MKLWIYRFLERVKVDQLNLCITLVILHEKKIELLGATVLFFLFTLYIQNYTLYCHPINLWLSPRPISIVQLHVLPRFHLRPINLVVFKGSYWLDVMGYLILRGASRLDAFSVYPVQTWLLGHALGRTTDTPEVRPSRSSRTKDSSSQISYAYAG